MSLQEEFWYFLKLEKISCFLFLVSEGYEFGWRNYKLKIVVPVQCNLLWWHHCLWLSNSKVVFCHWPPLINPSVDQFFHTMPLYCTQVLDFESIDLKADPRNPWTSLQYWLLPGHILWWQHCKGGRHTVDEHDAYVTWVGGRCRLKHLFDSDLDLLTLFHKITKQTMKVYFCSMAE